ncbi:MAG: glycosyltransferase family 4 protein [Rhodopila sp.]
MLNRILVTTDAVGGVWRYSLELAHGLAAHGIEVVLAVLGPAPNLAQRREAAALGARLVETDLPLDWLAENPGEVEHAVQALAAMARRLDADTVQLHTPSLVGHARWPVPVIAVAHSCVGTWWQAVRAGPLPADMTWRAEATATGIANADFVTAPTRAFADALCACYGTTRAIDVVHNGRTAVAANSRRCDHILTAGRLWDEGKNIATLDAAAATWRWPVLAAGPSEGPNGARFVAHNMTMLGPLQEIELAEEYARASIFVSLARYEPFGLAVLEAAQAGCALVLSDIPTFRELWEGAAAFVPPDDRHAITAAVEPLFLDPGSRLIAGESARRRAAAFTAAHMADATRQIHQQAAARARAAA